MSEVKGAVTEEVVIEPDPGGGACQAETLQLKAPALAKALF